MAIKPTSEIILLKAPLYLDNKNQLTFKNKTEQFNYFNSLPKVSIDNAYKGVSNRTKRKNERVSKKKANLYRTRDYED